VASSRQYDVGTSNEFLCRGTKEGMLTDVLIVSLVLLVSVIKQHAAFVCKPLMIALVLS